MAAKLRGVRATAALCVEHDTIPRHEEFAGKFLLMVFTNHHDCEICFPQTEVWAKMTREFQDQLRLVAVVPEGSLTEVVRARLGVELSFITDQEWKLFSRFGVPNTPYVVLVDPESRILYAAKLSGTAEVAEAMYYLVGEAITSRGVVRAVPRSGS